jgi:hypothetical protein
VVPPGGSDIVAHWRALRHRRAAEGLGVVLDGWCVIFLSATASRTPSICACTESASGWS